MKINRLCTDEEKNKKGVYKISNTHDGGTYVGSTRRPFRLRFNNHSCALFGNWHSTPHLQKAFNKHDCEWNFEIIEVVDQDSLIREREMYWIRTLRNQGVIIYNNHDVTTNDVFQHTEETRRKISEVKKGTNKGIIPKNFAGIKERQQRPIVEKENGVVIREYTSAKEAGNKLRIDYRTINNLLRGVTKSCEAFPGKTWEYKDGKPSRKIKVNPNRKGGGRVVPVVVLNKNGDKIGEFRSCAEAASNIGMSITNVQSMCNGRVKFGTRYKCVIRYKRDYDKLLL